MKAINTVLLFCLLGGGVSGLAASRHGSEDRDHVSFGGTITIDDGETGGDVVCAFCRVRARGDVAGDLVAFFGNVEVAEGRAISGDTVLFGGDLKLAKDARLGRDLVLFGSDLQQDPSAILHGDRVVFSGGAWLLVLLIPLLIPVGIIWLIVWLVRRGRYRVPAYPGGRY